ncbi:uncharacterized protein C8orf88 homolog isoform X2 [Pseudophryne corroboree]|uniref:uncharacterized protein C8orf88 homolog isoform X2 n=1 Tax=Pseudophryne corroboree TaxID=495146 RepID=UPI003081CB3D
MALSGRPLPARPHHSTGTRAECGPGGGAMTAGCHVLLNEMDVKKIRKPLQPARPIRRSVSGNGPQIMLNLRTEFTDCCKDNIQDNFRLWCSINNLYGALKDPVVPTQPEKPQMPTRKDRITYTRDFLIQLSSLSVSKERPKYLPDHPVVLQRPLFDLSATAPPSSAGISV